MLAVDFYESGKGETIIITFPDGGIGVVDAHPSTANSRPPVEDLVRGKNIHFVCLTHPHADHGLDLMKVFGSARNIQSYWHTVTDVQSIQYAVTQQNAFPSRYNSLLEVMRKDWADFLIDLYYEVGTRDDAKPGFIHRIHAERRTEQMGDVKIHFLGPPESEQSQYNAVYRDRLLGKHRNKPDENALSAILAVEYSGNLIILGADALSRNWRMAVERCRKEGLPKASILKIPHHGALNAFGGKKNSYTALLKPNSETFSVLFAGDQKHPHETVFADIKSRTNLQCLANGRKARGLSNPLGLKITGAVAIGSTNTCNAHIGFQISASGVLTQTAGARCSFCHH